MKATLSYNLNDPDDRMAHMRAVKSLDMASALFEITRNLRKKVIRRFEDDEKEYDELTSEIFKEVQKEIDQEILNQLRGGEPNPDIIPMDTTDRLFKQFMETSEGDPDLIWNKEQFVNMLLTDDDFYQEWGEDCCEELTYTERYNIWIGNNYETGIEYNPEIIPDFENDYYEPTPKRKLK